MNRAYVKASVCLLYLTTFAGACRQKNEAVTAESAEVWMNSFRSMPSELSANALADLLSEQKVTPEQGTEILQLLVSPRPIVRSAYSADKMAYYVLDYPVEGDFRGMQTRVTTAYTYNGIEPGGGGVGGTSSYGRDRIGEVNPRAEHMVPLLQELPKTIIVAEECTVELFLDDNKPIEGRTPAYSCTVRTIVPIHFVNDQQAEEVVLFTDPTLDQRMRVAFSAIACSSVSSDSKLAVEVHKDTGVSWQDLPADAAFKMLFRDERGRVLDVFQQGPGGASRFFAGSSGQTTPFGLNNDLEKYPLPKGTHAGHLVFQLSPEGAYYDPRIGAIWGGTLEFPMTLVVEDYDGRIGAGDDEVVE